jgi:SAM-dependent methyltransferase
MKERTPPEVAGFDEPLRFCYLPRSASHGESIPVNDPAHGHDAASDPVVPRHPARFADRVLNQLSAILAAEATTRGRYLRVLDPFAGVGLVHGVGQKTVGVEIELDWAAAHPRTVVGDATALPVTDATFDAVATSPCYGNRLADHHDAKDASRRHTYRHCLGRPLASNNAGALQWGERYRTLHALAWREAYRVLRVGGLCVVVVSDHIRKGQRQRVVDWHLRALLDTGFVVEQVLSVVTRRMRHGAHADLRVPDEKILVVRR